MNKEENLIEAVCVVVMNEDYILTNMDKQMPTGYQQPDENTFDAAKRILKREYSIEGKHFIKYGDITYEQTNLHMKYVLCDDFTGEPTKGTFVKKDMLVVNADWMNKIIAEETFHGECR